MWPPPFYTLSLMFLMLMVIVLLDIIKRHGFCHDLFDDLWPRAFCSGEWKQKRSGTNGKEPGGAPGGGEEEGREQKLCVMQEHGFVCAVLFFLFGIARWLMPTFLLVRPVPKWFLNKALWNTKKNKSHVWWHDVSYLISLGVLWFLPLMVFPLLFPDVVWSAKNTTWLAGWVLLDIFIYHVNMFWFDELRPWVKTDTTGKTEESICVLREKKKEDRPGSAWSLRRASFQAIISYVVSIHVFAYLYCPVDLETSFAAATLNVDPPSFAHLFDLPAVQMLFSLVLLVVIISSTASAAFKRGEIANR